MTPPPVTAPRLMVYKLAIYGGKDRVPLIAASIAKELGITPPTVHGHLKALALAGYIKPIGGAKYAVLYTRGKWADLLDEQLRGGPNISSGGGPNHQNCCSVNKNPLPVPVGESHIDGRFVFPVLHEGGHHIKVREDQGVRSIEIFSRKPVKWDNGVEYYSGLVPMDDGEVRVQFWDTKSPQLHVWPLPVPIVASTAYDAKARLQEAAERVTAILSKWGGWRFGPPEFISNEPGKEGIHYATNDPLVMQRLSPGFVPEAETGYRVDGTPPPRSLECDDPASAEAMLGYIIATRELRAGQKDLGRRLQVIEGNADRLINISEKLEVAMSNMAATEALLIEKAAKNLGDKVESSSGVMYS